MCVNNLPKAVTCRQSELEISAYLARPLKNFPIAIKSSWSEQLNTTHWIAIALARSYKQQAHHCVFYG